MICGGYGRGGRGDENKREENEDIRKKERRDDGDKRTMITRRRGRQRHL